MNNNTPLTTALRFASGQSINDILERDALPDDIDDDEYDDDVVDGLGGHNNDSMQVDGVVGKEKGKGKGKAKAKHTTNESSVVPVAQGLCSECGDQASAVSCEQCIDDFCDVCYKAMHRKGARKSHTVKRLREDTKMKDDNNNNNTIDPHDNKENGNSDNSNDDDNNNNNANTDSSTNGYDSRDKDKEKDKEDRRSIDDDTNKDDSDDEDNRHYKRPYYSSSGYSSGYYSGSGSIFGVGRPLSNYHYNSRQEVYSSKPPPPPASPYTNKYIPVVTKDGPWFEDRAKYIPLRLTLEERKELRLLDSSLHVCDYTDRVDVPALSASKSKRMLQQLKEICAILCGIRASYDQESGSELVANRDFAPHTDFFQTIFEIGRRHKIMNPEKMRTEYGKLVYMLQDAMTNEIQDLIKFIMVRPVLTVHTYLTTRGAGAMLQDPFMEIATREITSEKKERYEIQDEIKQKERAIKYLSKKFSSDKISVDEIERCLYSIGDNHAFLREARDPIDKMIEYLTKYFSADKVVGDYSLAISAGTNGARLTHNHARQYHYVLQSLLLWREVTHDMFKLWILAEQDLLESGNQYRLKDTGQGLNRLQPASRISKAMTGIVHKVQARVGDNWVGSSVVHLGDHNVPNALMFIDKYTQISRILNPIITALRSVETLMKDPQLKDYIENKFESLENCRKQILCDFFKFAFDGSGADNFFDAGSCIDGRLTSAWHWCSQIDKKPFYHVFLLTGFIGFDGQFW